jgi:hypothetical protein
MSTRTIRTSLSLLLAMLLVASMGAGTVLAAKKDKKDKKADQAATVLAQIESIKGIKYRMAKAPMANRVIRFADATGDQVGRDGTPALEAPEWSDIEAVYVAPTRLHWKLQASMREKYLPGTTGTFYGTEADWRKDDRAVFVAVKMADDMPPEAGGQQVEVGLGGAAAVPVQPGMHLDTRTGIERFSLSGLFSNGAYATGSTDVSDRQPGDDIEYYNTESGVFGFYDRKSATWFLVMPRTKELDSVVVSVRSSTDVGEVTDRLELPGGGHFVDLARPAGGFGKKAGVAPLACRSLETFSAESGLELSDPEATLIRYTAGMAVDHDPAETAKILAPAIDGMGAVEVALTAVGSEDPPLMIDADLAVAPQSNAVSLTFEAPAGQWQFALSEGTELVTPAGESIIDHHSLTGSAGVLTGPGLDGFVAGDLSCAADGSEAVAMAEIDEADEDATPETESAEDEPEG